MAVNISSFEKRSDVLQFLQSSRQKQIHELMQRGYSEKSALKLTRGGQEELLRAWESYQKPITTTITTTPPQTLPSTTSQSQVQTKPDITNQTRGFIQKVKDYFSPTKVTETYIPPQTYSVRVQDYISNPMEVKTPTGIMTVTTGKTVKIIGEGGSAFGDMTPFPQPTTRIVQAPFIDVGGIKSFKLGKTSYTRELTLELPTTATRFVKQAFPKTYGQITGAEQKFYAKVPYSETATRYAGGVILGGFEFGAVGFPSNIFSTRFANIKNLPNWATPKEVPLSATAYSGRMTPDLRTESFRATGRDRILVKEVGIEGGLTKTELKGTGINIPEIKIRSVGITGGGESIVKTNIQYPYIDIGQFGQVKTGIIKVPPIFSSNIAVGKTFSGTVSFLTRQGSTISNFDLSNVQVKTRTSIENAFAGEKFIRSVTTPTAKYEDFFATSGRNIFIQQGYGTGFAQFLGRGTRTTYFPKVTETTGSVGTSFFGGGKKSSPQFFENLYKTPSEVTKTTVATKTTSLKNLFGGVQTAITQAVPKSSVGSYAGLGLYERTQEIGIRPISKQQLTITSDIKTRTIQPPIITTEKFVLIKREKLVPPISITQELPRTSTGTSVGLIQITTPTIRIEQSEVPALTELTRIPTPIMTNMPIPPPIITGGKITGFPPLPFGFGESLYSRAIPRRKRRSKYTPSYEALIFGIKGKMPKGIETGIRTRPIPKGFKWSF